MPTLSHGSDLRLAPTLTPLVQTAGLPPRKALSLVGAQGFSAVQLDATLAGIRPRELDTTARRDLLATAKRCGLTIAGIDFFIPGEHYSDPQYLDRALASAIAACVLAGELGRVPVSLNLPIQKVDASLVGMIADSADAHGVSLAIHDEADLDGLVGWLKSNALPHVGLGLDPAALLIRDVDPSAMVQKLASPLRVARLSDASQGQADGGRQVLGSGSLSVMPYRVSVDLAPNRIGPVVLDVRGLASPLDAMKSAKSVWDGAAIKL
jgi:sugar phosphate isomerase/epimerase